MEAPAAAATADTDAAVAIEEENEEDVVGTRLGNNRRDGRRC
jgi:hypothetical protein